MTWRTKLTVKKRMYYEAEDVKPPERPNRIWKEVTQNWRRLMEIQGRRSETVSRRIWWVLAYLEVSRIGGGGIPKLIIYSLNQSHYIFPDFPSSSINLQCHTAFDQSGIILTFMSKLSQSTFTGNQIKCFCPKNYLICIYFPFFQWKPDIQLSMDTL